MNGKLLIKSHKRKEVSRKIIIVHISYTEKGDPRIGEIVK